MTAPTGGTGPGSTGPGSSGPGSTGPQARWEKLADEVARQVPVAEIDGVWIFELLKNGPQEAGTAIISRVHGDRRRIYTARYVAMVKGKTRGLWQSTIEEVGSGPIEALDRLLADVEKRVDEGAPTPVAVVEWFPERGTVATVRAVEAVGDTAAGPPTAGTADTDSTPPTNAAQ